MSRARDHSHARRHAILADTYEIRTSSGARDPEAWTRGAASFLAFHRDVAEHALGDRGELHELLSDEGVRAAQRRLLGSSRQCLTDLRRGLASAVRRDRLDRVAEVLAWYAGEDHASRGGLGAWPGAHAAGDHAAVVAILRDSRRPELERALLAWEVHCVLGGGNPPEKALVEALSVAPRPGEGAWHALAHALEQALPASLGLDSGAAPRRDVPSFARPRSELPAVEVLPSGCSIDAAAQALEGLGARGPLRLGAWIVAASEGALSGERVRDVAAALEASLALPWVDAEREALAEAFDSAARDAFEASGADVIGWFARLVVAIGSDQRGNLSRTIAVLATLLRGPAELRRAFLFVRARLESLPERRWRSVALQPLVLCLADEVIARGIPDDLGAVLVALVELEATALVRPNADFLLLGVGRRAGALGDGATVRAVFDGLASHWVRGQLIRRIVPHHLAVLPVDDLPGAIENLLARMFAFESVVRARGPYFDDEGFDRALALAESPHAEVLVVQFAALVHACARHPRGAHRLTRIWERLGAALEGLADDFAARVLDALAECFPSAPTDPAVVAWAHRRAATFDTARASLWPAWITGRAPMPVPSPTPPDLLAPAWKDRDAATLAYRACSFTLDDPDAWSGVPVHVARELLQRIGPAEPTVFTVSVVLALAVRAVGVSLEGWHRDHRAALAVARGLVAVDAALLDAHPSRAFVRALLDIRVGDPASDRALAAVVRHPAMAGAIRARLAEYREFDLGRTTGFVARHGRALLLRLCDFFLADSFPEGLVLQHMRPIAQNLCAEALARYASTDELRALVRRWVSRDRGAP